MEGKVALVTGAAGGIGAATVRALAERGARVAAVDREAAGNGARAAKCVADGLDVTPFTGDVGRSADVEAVVRSVEEGIGPIDFLVNAAGVLHVGAADALSEQDWTATLTTNATGVFLVSRAVVSRMKTRGRGAVVTVASNAAAVPRQGMAAYAASKAAATMFTKCLGLEAARYGIRCNVVAPGSTDTPMLRGMWADDTGARSTIEGRPEEFRVGIPLGRLAGPADIADAVLFLLSERAGHITMHELTVDGGAALGA
ncbi:2,3-dihydro-2,3-dihydroxybenzoate dehydrogenase [Actinoplanes sp. NPDC051411]|uniref:2,3-dihydro-2,3-dihydroxybenzoate dehydrogenase n=1 Tax=Actinoplanes sp. NPDC051411 TaxID=3155522 RepID=UPI003436AF2B